jgi:1-acyl-sn-glycerol-3-phosphate acyltransferase
LKGAAHALVLLVSLFEVLVWFAVLRVRCRGEVSLELRARWLHRACNMIARRLSMRVSASGPLPRTGLIVSNHLSYLDILFFSSLMPCIFVSKSEVLSWPLFGILARCGGSIFVHRGRATVIDRVSSQIATALQAGIPVVLFPEGTSTDGTSVLRFFPALFEAAIQTKAPVFPSAIAYELGDGQEVDLCYYGDITFGTHLPTALARRDVHARILFATEAAHYPDRKSAAAGSREQVIAYRQIMTGRESRRGVSS